MRFLIALVLLIQTPVAGQMMNGSMRLAESYFDAGDFARAEAEYASIQEDSMPAWQQAILLYDLGTVLMAAGKYEEALTRFQAAEALAVGLPLLEQRLSANRVLANLMLVKVRLKTLQGNAEASNREYYHTILLFRQLGREIKTATTAWCARASAEGSTQCPSSLNLEEMRNEVQSLYAELLNHYEAFSQKQSSHGEGTVLAIERLLTSYGMALIRDPLQEKDLSTIVDKQAELGKMLVNTEAPIKEDYAQAEKYLRLSRHKLLQSFPDEARLYAEVARFFISNIANQMFLPKKNRTEALLENIIDAQEFALILPSLDQRAGNEEERKTLLALIQKRTLAAAATFLPTVLSQQSIAFAGTGKRACQCHPWDAVIPLFSEGYAQARRADEILQKEEQEAVPQRQEAAVSYWREALAKMRAAPSSAAAEAKTAEAAPKVETGRQSLNEALRNVQEMENDDRSDRHILVPGGKGVDRPW